MREVLDLFLSPENTFTTDRPSNWLSHACDGIETFLALPRLKFFEPARVYVVRVQIDIEHAQAAGEWEPMQIGFLVDSCTEMREAERLVDERRRDAARMHAKQALSLLENVGRCAA